MLQSKNSREPFGRHNSRSAEKMVRAKTADGIPSRQRHNRHEKCIEHALNEREELKPFQINNKSHLLASQTHNRPIQDRAKEIMQTRNYRLQLQRQHREQKQRELEDLQMKREKSVSKTKKKLNDQNTSTSPAQNQLRGIQNLADHLRYQAELETMRERQLLKVAMLREEQIESSLVARLRQLSPYSRLSVYAMDEILKTNRRDSRPMGTLLSPIRYSLTPNDHFQRSPLRSTSPGFRADPTRKTHQHHQPSSTATRKSTKKPNELRKLLEVNRQEILSFLTEILERRPN